MFRLSLTSFLIALIAVFVVHTTRAHADSKLSDARASYVVYNQTGATLSFAFERLSGDGSHDEWTRFDLAPGDEVDVDVPAGRIEITVKPKFLTSIAANTSEAYRSNGSQKEISFAPSSFGQSALNDPANVPDSGYMDAEGAAIRSTCKSSPGGQRWTLHDPNNPSDNTGFHRAGDFICGDKQKRVYILKNPRLLAYRCSAKWTKCTPVPRRDGEMLAVTKTQDVTIGGKAVTIYRYPFKWTQRNSANWVMSIHN